MDSQRSLLNHLTMFSPPRHFKGVRRISHSLGEWFNNCLPTLWLCVHHKVERTIWKMFFQKQIAQWSWGHSCITTDDHCMCVIKKSGQLAYTNYGQLQLRFLVKVLAQVVFINYKSPLNSNLTCLFQIPWALSIVVCKHIS
jgi:hypothetical protein